MDSDFRKALAGVVPLVKARRAVRERPRPPLPRETIAPEEDTESGWQPTFVRPGYSPALLRKLRRGRWVVEDSLDLHGMNRSEAAAAVREFLHGCRARRLGCVRIVHGKGLGSRNREPVLKGKVYHWLKLRDEVLAFSQAPTADGGAGAVLVLLRS